MVTDRRRVQEQWTRQADAYTTSHLHRGTPDLDLMVRMVHPRASWTALDLATGGGHTARKFAPHVQRVVAFDLTRRMLENSRGLALEEHVRNILPVQGDVLALPLRDATFDLVTVRAATHHFPDVPRALAEVHRVLRGGGLLLVNDSLVPDDPAVGRFMNEAEVLRDPTHVRSYSRRQWEAFLGCAGFAVEGVEEWRKVHDFQFWMGLAGMGAGAQGELERRFLSAPPPVVEALGLRRVGGRVKGFSDPKGLFLARRS